ncbi:flagellar type III secretion system pore protein FliP [Stomatohabitans albus]|uniref:flagellar type III secretion system pore protein FliP n=1 Tax=Stomatohabitans albus TaxID=3110766 RepID=UPI00300D2508
MPQPSQSPTKVPRALVRSAIIQLGVVLMLGAVLAVLVMMMDPGTPAQAQNVDVGAQLTQPDIGDPLNAGQNQLDPGVPSVQSPTAGDQVPVLESTGNANQFSLNVDGINRPSQAVTILVTLTVVSLAPSLLMMFSSFTRIVIVLSATRNAIGMPSVPPSQVVVGLALFLALFTMTPTLTQVNETAIQPYLNAEITVEQAISNAQAPIRTFMMHEVGDDELELFIGASGDTRPASPQEIPLTTLMPAFVLSEIKTAFIMVFVINIPFLLIDLIVAAVLMSMGMMMLPPVTVSLPFKLLLFVMVDGWGLVVQSILRSFA